MTRALTARTAGSPSPSPSAGKQTPLTAALAQALEAEHAAVYGYGVVGAKSEGQARSDARTAYDTHRARRDELARALQAQGTAPQAAAPAYGLPFPVTGAQDAARLAVHLEDGAAACLAELVRAASGELRGNAARWLQETAVRAARWRGAGTAFPGLPERAPGAGASAGASADPSATAGSGSGSGTGGKTP